MAFDLIPEDSINLGAYKSAAQKFSANYPNGITNPYEEKKVEGDRSRLDTTIYSKAYEYAQVDWDNAVSAVTRKRQDFLDLYGQFYSSGSYVDAYGNVKSNQNALDAADRYEFAEYLHDLYPEFSVDYFYKNAESFMKQATGVEANIKSYADHIGKTWNMAWSNFALGWEAFTNYVGYGLTGQFGSQAWENKKEEMAQHRAVSAANYRKDLGDDVYDGLLQKMLSGTVEQSPQIAMMLAQMALTGGVGGVSGYLASKEMIKSSTAQTLAKVAKGLSVATNFAISGIGDGGSAMSDCYEFGFSDETSLWAGLLVGLFTGYVETWGDDQLLKPLNDAVDRVLKLGDGDLMHQAVKSFGESLKDSAWKKARHVAASEITEPAQEELEYMAELFIKAVANQYEISTGGGTDWESIGYTKEQFWENTKETIVQTMLSTPLMTLGGLAASSGFDVVMGQGSAQWTPKRYMNKEGATNVTSTANFYLGGLKVDENIKDGDNGKANPIKVVQIGDYIFPTEAVSKKQEEAIRNKMVVYTIDEGSKLTTKTKTELEATSVDPDVTLTREKAGEYLAVMYEKGVLESYGFGEEEGLLDKISNKIKEESSPLESQSTEETDVLYVELKGKDSPVKINIGEEMSTQGSLDELQDITGVHMESIMSETAREARIRKKAEEIEKKRAAKQAEKDKKAGKVTDNTTQNATVTPDIVQAVKTEAQAQANTTGTNTTTSTPADTQTIDTSRALNYRNFERFYKNEQFSSYEAYDAALNPTTDYLYAKYVKLSKEDGNSIVVSLPPSEVSKKAILNNVSTNPYKAEVKQTNVQQAKEKTSDTKKALEAVGVDTGTAGTVKTVSTEKQKTEVEKKQTQETKSETKESKAQNETKKESVKPIGEGELTDEEGKTWKSLEFCQEDDLTEEKKKHGKLLKKTSDGETDYYYYEDGTALMVEDVTREQVKWMKEHPEAYKDPANTAPTEGEVISKSADIAKQNNVSNDEGTEAAVIGVGVQNAQDLITKNQTSFDDVVNKLTEEYIKKAIGEKKKLSKKLRAVAEAISKIEGIDNVYRQIFGENATVNETTKEEFSKLFIDYMNNRDVEINEATKVFFDTIKQGVLASYLVNESTIQGDEKTELNTLKDKETKETKTSKEALKDLQKKEEKQVKEESQKEKENATKQEETTSETKPENKEESKQETNEEVKTETKEETKEETKTEAEKPADPKTVISENPVLRTAVALAMEARKYYRYQEGLQQDEAKKKHMHDLFVIYDDWYTKMVENLDTNTAYEFLSSTEASRLITLQGNTYKVKGKKKDGTIVDMDKKFAVDPSFLSKRKEAILSDYIVTYYSTEVAKEVMTKQDLKALSISPYLVSKMGTALVNGIDSYFSDIIKNDFLSAITIEGQPDKGETYRDYVIRKLREMQTPEDDLTVMSNIATTISNIDMTNVDERDMAIMNDSALRKNFQNIMSQILLEDFLNQYPEGTKTSKAKIEEYINKKWNNSVSNFTNLMADTSIYNVFKNLAKYEANATEKLTPEVEDKVREQRGVSSATDNNGDFSSESDDIRYQDSATPLNQTIQGKVNPANVVSSFKYDTSKGKFFISGGVYNEIVEIMNSSFPIQNEDIRREVRKTATLATAFLTSLSEDVQDALVRKSIKATGGKLLTGENENLLRLFFNMNELKDTSSVSDTTKGLSLSQSAKIILGMNSDESTVRHEGAHIIWWLDPKFRERAQNEYKKYFEKDSEGKQIRAVVEAHLDRFGGYTADQIIEGLRNLTRDDYDYTSDAFLSSEEAIAYMGEIHWEGLDDIKYSEGLKGLFERLANILKNVFEKLKNFFNTDLLVETNNNIYAPLFENEAGAREYYNELRAQEAEYITIPERAHAKTIGMSADGSTMVAEREGTLFMCHGISGDSLEATLENGGRIPVPSLSLTNAKHIPFYGADKGGFLFIANQEMAERYMQNGWAFDRDLASGMFPEIEEHNTITYDDLGFERLRDILLSIPDEYFSVYKRLDDNFRGYISRAIDDKREDFKSSSAESLSSKVHDLDCNTAFNDIYETVHRYNNGTKYPVPTDSFPDLAAKAKDIIKVETGIDVSDSVINALVIDNDIDNQVDVIVNNIYKNTEVQRVYNEENIYANAEDLLIEPIDILDNALKKVSPSYKKSIYKLIRLLAPENTLANIIALMAEHYSEIDAAVPTYRTYGDSSVSTWLSSKELLNIETQKGISTIVENGQPATMENIFALMNDRPVMWATAGPYQLISYTNATKIKSIEDAHNNHEWKFEGYEKYVKLGSRDRTNTENWKKAVSVWQTALKYFEELDRKRSGNTGGFRGVVLLSKRNDSALINTVLRWMQDDAKSGSFDRNWAELYTRLSSAMDKNSHEEIEKAYTLAKTAIQTAENVEADYGEVKAREILDIRNLPIAIAFDATAGGKERQNRQIARLEAMGVKVYMLSELLDGRPFDFDVVHEIIEEFAKSTVAVSERVAFQKMADVVQGAYENEQLRDDVQAKEQYESLVYLHATKNAEKVIKNWRKSLGDFFVDENSISTLKSELENSGVFSAIQGISPELAEEVKDEVTRRIAYESEDYVSTAENLGKLKANLKDKNGEYKSADSKEVNDALYALYGYRQREVSNQNGTKTVETVPVGILSKIMANDSKGSYARVKEYLLSEFRQAENQTGITLDNELKQILLDKNEWKAIKKNGSSTVKESNNTALNFKLEEHGIEVQDLDNFLSILISENNGKYSPVMWRSNSEDAVFSDGYTVSGPLVDMLNYIHKDETQQNYTKNPTAIADDVYIKAAYNTLDKTFKKGDKLDIYIMDQMSQDYLGAIEKVDSTLLKNVYGTKLSADFFEELKKSIDKNLQNKIDDLNEVQAQADLFEGVSSTDELVKVLDSVFEEINTTTKTVTKTVDGLSGLTSLEIHNLKQQFESAKKTIEELKKQEEVIKNSDVYKKNSKIAKERDAAIKKADEAIKNYKNRKARIIEEAANILTAAGRMNLKDTNLTAEAKDALYQVNNLIKDLRQEIRTLEKDNNKLTNQLNEAITRLSNELGIARGMAKDFNNAGVLSLFELQIREMQNVAKDSGNDIVSKKLSKILEYLVPQIAKGAERLMPKDVISFETIYTSLISPNYQEYRSHANALMNFILSEMSEPSEVPNVYKISKTVRQLTAGQLVELSNLVSQVASDSMKYYKETTQQERDYHSEWHKAIAREIVEFAKEKGINAGELTEADSIGASSAKDIAVSKLQSLFNEFMLKSVEYRDRFPTLYAYIYGGVDHQGKVWEGLNGGMNEVSASAREKFDRIKKSIINNFSNSMFFEGELTEKNLADNMNALKTKYETTLSEDTFTQEDMKATGYTISEYDHLNRKKRTVFVDEDNDSAMREVARWWGKKQIKLFKLRDKLDSTFEKFGNKNRQIDLRRNIIYNAQVGIEKTKTLTTIDEKEKQARITKLENRIKATQDLLSRDYDIQASRSEKMEILKRRIKMAEQELGTRPNANVAKYTTQELLAIYMYARQEGGIDRLVYTPSFDKDGNALPNGSKTNNLSIGNIIWVVKQFENNSEFAPLKKFADDLSSIASENFEKIRDVKYYLSDGNVWLDPIKNYFAFTVDEDAFYEYGADIDTGLLAKYNEVGEAEVKHLAKNAKANDSMTKERTGNNALNLKIMDRMFNAIYRQEYYIGMGKPIYELKGLLNDEEFQSAMRTYYGRNGGNQQLVSLGKYVNALGNSQKTVSASAIDETVRFLTSNTAAAAMAFRLTTVAQQIPTMLWCLKDKHIGLKGLISAMWRAFSDKGVYKYSPQMEERANSALSAIRQSKNIGTFLSQSARFKGLGISVEKFINQAQNTGLWLLEKTDTYIANAMWYAYYEGVRQENIEKGLNNSLSVEEFNTLCANEATQRVMDISPVQSAKDNAVMYSNKNPWVRSALLFTNQTTKMLNGIIGSFRDMDIKGAEYLAKVLGISVLTFVLNGLITGKLIRKSKDDDDDEAKVHLISNTFYSIEQGVMDLFPLLDSIIGEENYGETNLRTDIENLVNVIGKDKDDRSEHQLANAWSYLVTDIMSGAGFAGTEARSIYRAFREGNPVYAYNTKWGEFTDRSEK